MTISRDWQSLYLADQKHHLHFCCYPPYVLRIVQLCMLLAILKARSRRVTLRYPHQALWHKIELTDAEKVDLVAMLLGQPIECDAQ